MLLNSRQFKFLKNYRNVYVKSSAKRVYRDENVFLKGDRALGKLITLLILNKKEFNHFFKRNEARNTEREARRSLGRGLILASEASRIFKLLFIIF